MIKETLTRLSHELNRLDPESDTLLLVDWETRNIVLSQRPNDYIISNYFWVLIENERTSGKSLDMISSNKLKSIKTYILRIINNQDIITLVPNSYGFTVKKFFELIYQGKSMNSWTTETKFNFRNTIFMKVVLYLASKSYRSLRRSLLDIKFK